MDKKRKNIVLDSYSFTINRMEYENGLNIYLSTPIEDAQQNVVKIYRKTKDKEPVVLSIGNYRRKTTVTSVVCSGDSEIGIDLKNYRAIDRCKIVLDISYQDCKHLF